MMTVFIKTKFSGTKLFRFLIMPLLMLFFTGTVCGQTSVKQRNWNLNGYVKYMQTVSFTKIDEQWMTDNLIHNRLKFNWYPGERFTLNAEMRNRIFYGETVTNFPQYSDIVNGDNGFLDLTFNPFSSKSVFMNSTFDRLFVDYTAGKFQITVGRQRINWGQTFVWNPNDLFNTYSFFDFDYEEKPGSDAVRIQYYPSWSSVIDVVVKADSGNRITAAALYRFNKRGYDFQLIAGYLEETDFVAGAGFSGTLLKGGFRGECSYFRAKENFADTTGVFTASLEYDYTFKNSFMIQAEALYNGFGRSSGDFNLMEFYFMRMSPKNLSLTKFSFMGQVSYPFTPLFKGTFAAMYSPNDHSLYVGPSLIYSLAENLELSLYTQYFTSQTAVEAGGRGGFIFWRLKWSF